MPAASYSPITIDHSLRSHRRTRRRPVFHRLEHRICAHILLSWLALLLVRSTESQTNQTWRRITLELQRLHLVTLTSTTGTLQQTTRLTDAQREILTAAAIPAPPRITTLQPA